MLGMLQDTGDAGGCWMMLQDIGDVGGGCWMILQDAGGYCGGSGLNSPHILLAHICCMDLCKSIAFRRAPVVSCKQHPQSLWTDSKDGIFSWLHKRQA